MGNKIIYNGEEYAGSIVNDTGVGEFTSNEGKKNPTGANSERFNNYFSNTASGDYSHAEGCNTTANGHYSHAEGWGTTAGNTAHAEGNSTIASGQYSHAEGSYAEATGLRSHAEGESTHATNTNSHAEGHGTIASGIQSHAEGYNTLASNNSAHAEGYETEATTGEGPHAEGKGTHATAGGAHAEGINTTASGIGSHAEGNNTTAYGNYSHASGTDTYAGNTNSIAVGLGTKAITTEQVVLGKYNIEDQTSAIIVGNGTIDNTDYYIYNGNNILRYKEKTTYQLDDIVWEYHIYDTSVTPAVQKDPSAYKCIQSGRGKLPKKNPTYWQLLEEYLEGPIHPIAKSNLLTLSQAGILNVIGTNADIQINGTSVTSSGDIANPNISDAYDNTTTYAVGDYCIYNNNLYKCNTDISIAEDFDSTKWIATTIGAELLNIKSRLSAIETSLGGLSFAATSSTPATPSANTVYFVTPS